MTSACCLGSSSKCQFLGLSLERGLESLTALGKVAHTLGETEAERPEVGARRTDAPARLAARRLLSRPSPEPRRWRVGAPRGAQISVLPLPFSPRRAPRTPLGASRDNPDLLRSCLRFFLPQPGRSSSARSRLRAGAAARGPGLDPAPSAGQPGPGAHLGGRRAVPVPSRPVPSPSRPRRPPP